MFIEEAKLLDAEEILKLQKLAFQSEAEIHNNFNIPPLVQNLDALRADFRKYQFFKGIRNDQIKAAVKVRMHENGRLSIERLVVHPKHQGIGLGKQMIKYIEGRYVDVSGFELFTAEKSHRNLAFYKSMGYRITRKIEEPGHDNISLVALIKDVNI